MFLQTPIQKTTVLIIEDEAAIRSMLNYALQLANFSVVEAADTRQADLLIEKEIPDLILLDWMLPNKSGISYTKQLKQHVKTRNIPIIMLTAKADEVHKVKGLNAGVDDYIVKPFSPKELVARVNAVLRRGPLKQPDKKIGVLAMLVDAEAQRVSINDEIVKLGRLEYRLLYFFITHRDRVFSRNELLSRVWGVDAYVDDRTVDVHIRRLRKALEAFGYQKIIQTVHGSGYRFSEKHINEC